MKYWNKYGNVLFKKKIKKLVLKNDFKKCIN